MKKKISLLCLFILGLFLVPKLVLADEIPRTGVHYFLTYPNGEEVVTKDYDEAMKKEEKLIYSGLTGSNGEVVLEGLLNQGTLRIVQKVPNGYSTDTTEITLDLSQGTNNVEFVDYKGSNPNTGQSILFIVGVIAVLAIAFVVVKKDHKKLLILPLFVVGALLLQVKADNDNLVITIKDKAGNKLAGVEVEVYATPVVDYGAAVTYDANGGKFFDGTDKMYFRLPSAECSWDDFFDSLTEDEYDHLSYNMFLSSRTGYAYNGTEGDEDDTVNDNTVVKLVWEADSEVRYVTVHGNGGVLDFFGTPLEEYVIVDHNVTGALYFLPFVNGKLYLTGISNGAACTSLIEFDNPELVLPSDVYACWGPRPDGIFVDEAAFVGNLQDCFEDHYVTFSYHSLDFTSFTYNLEMYEQDGELYMAKYAVEMVFDGSDDLGETGAAILEKVGLDDDGGIPEQQVNTQKVYYGIESLEVIKDGNVLVSLSENDITLAMDGYFKVTNAEKKATLLNYFNELGTTCGDPEFSDSSSLPLEPGN